MLSRRPTIGITGRVRDSIPGRAELYSKAVEEAGGAAFFISTDDDLRSQAASYDGFVIPGGRDIAPSFYAEVPEFSFVPEDRSRIDFEISLLREIIRLRKPALGICYGMQLLNVFFGGTLYQDICSQKEDSLNHREGMHPVNVIDNPFMETGVFEVNTSHHQAVKAIGEGIRTCAFAPDGIVEAVYHEDFRFIVGLQWHPERMDTTLSRKIFRRLVEECGADK